MVGVLRVGDGGAEREGHKKMASGAAATAGEEMVEEEEEELPMLDVATAPYRACVRNWRGKLARR
jgi:hypothetical protein